jgi:hypothetical protein
MATIIEGLRQRDDLRPKRGWSTSPNVFRDPTFYEVLGTDLTPANVKIRAQIEAWLLENDKRLLVGTRHGSYGTTTEVELRYSNPNGCWLVISYFSYSGG